MNKQPHILCDSRDISPNVLLPGDPGRVRYIADTFLAKSKLVAANREFVTAIGMYKGVRITVTSTGIGCPSTAIATEELINCGAKILIRVGTCGGALKQNIPVGSIIVPTACVREEGTTKEYIPAEFPAVSDYRIVAALEKSAIKNSYRYFVGINRTHDAFYGQSKNIKAWGSPYLDPRMKSWNYPLISSEMEASALFIIASMRGVQAGAVLAVNAPPETLSDIVRNTKKFSTPQTSVSTAEAKKSVDRAIRCALDAIVDLQTSQ